MPVGPYDTHAECVADNQGKSDPDAFCAWLKERTSAGGVSSLQLERGDVRVGSWVEWTWQDGTAQGKIESIHTEGPVNVPGADVTLDADEDNPAALIESWVEVGESGEYRPTGTMVGRRFASLRSIEPLPEADDTAAVASAATFEVEVGGGVLPDAYRPADSDDVPDGLACSNCVFYSLTQTREVDGVTEGWCDWWAAHVRPDYYCDAWASGMPETGEDETMSVDDEMGYKRPDEEMGSHDDEEMAGHDEDEEMSAGWRGVLAVEGVPTGDGRLMTEGSLRWDTPLPLRWVREDRGAHDGAQVVGRILSISRVGERIEAEGDFDMGSESGREAHRQVSEGLTVGVSVDLDDVDVEMRMPADMVDEDMDVDVSADLADDGRVVVQREASDDVMTVITDARVRAATIVDIPAFVEARIEAMRSTGMRTLDRDERTPTAGMAEEAQRALDWRADGHAGGEEATVGRARSIAAREPLAAETIRRMHAFFARNAGYPDLDGFSPGDDGYPSPARVAWALWGGDAGRTWSATLVARMEADDMASVEDLTASSAVSRPPRGWFDDPGLSEPTALTVTEDGRVYGHLAVWGTCHTGIADACVTPPRSSSGYAYFRVGAVLCDDGSEVAVGRLTADTTHAGRRLSAVDTAAHYEHSGAAIADVAAGEDAHGIWVAGALRPGVSDEQVAALRASPLSGDWRSIGGSLELVAALAVNSPGFPVPRALVASGKTQSLQAAGVFRPSDQLVDDLSDADRRLLRAVLDRERRDAALRVRQAADARRRVRVAQAERLAGRVR